MERGWIWARGKVCEGARRSGERGHWLERIVREKNLFFIIKKIIQKNVFPKRFYIVLL